MDENLEELICTCGHPASEHHVSWFPGGGRLVEECEYYGYNDTGGMEYVEELGWVDHCQRFQESHV